MADPTFCWSAWATRVSSPPPLCLTSPVPTHKFRHTRVTHVPTTVPSHTRRAGGTLRTPTCARVAVPRGKFGQVKMPKGPRHRLQTVNQGARYVKGVHGLPNDHRLPTAVMFKMQCQGGSSSCASQGERTEPNDQIANQQSIFCGWRSTSYFINHRERIFTSHSWCVLYPRCNPAHHGTHLLGDSEWSTKPCKQQVQGYVKLSDGLKSGNIAHYTHEGKKGTTFTFHWLRSNGSRPAPHIVARRLSDLGRGWI
eukprot:1185526-Prorocentrum_minimum.AAC.9